MYKSDYDHSVTIAKALAIILMVVGHTGSPSWVNNYLSLMRMPLFFFMSGYCFKAGYLSVGGGKKWMKKRVKGIYWPYVKWGVVFVLLHNFFMSVGIYNDTSEFNGRVMHSYDWVEMIKKLSGVITMHGTERLLGGYWFLKSLFYGSFIFYVLRKLSSRIWLWAITLLMLTLISSYFNLKIPYFKVGSLELFSAFFIMVGHGMRCLQWKGKTIINSIITNLPAIVICAIVVGIGSVYWPTSMRYYRWYEVLPYAMTALLGTFVIFAIGNCINNWTIDNKYMILSKTKSFVKRFLIYTGRYTFNVLTWHFLSFKIISLIIILLYGLSWDRLGDFPVMSDYAKSGYWIIYLFAGVGLPMTGTYIYHHILDEK